jgi:hypothetical protein
MASGDRSTIFQKRVIAKQTGFGTVQATTANFRALTSSTIEPSYQIQDKLFAPSGFLVDTQQQIVKDTSAISYNSDTPAFEEVPIFANGALHTVAAPLNVAAGLTPDGLNTPYAWTYIPKATSADTPDIFTVQYGDDLTYSRVPNVMFTGMQFSIQAGSGVTLSGSGFGGKVTDTDDVAASFVSALAQPAMAAVPTVMPGTNICVYMAKTYADLHTADVLFAGTAAGDMWEVAKLDPTAKLTRITRTDWSVDNRWAEYTELDCTLGGAPSTFTTQKVSGSVSIQTGASTHLPTSSWTNTKGIFLLENMRATDTIWVCIQVNGPVIETYNTAATTINHEMRLYGAIKLQSPQVMDDQGLKAIAFKGTMIYDGTANVPPFAKMVVINKLATLLP